MGPGVVHVCFAASMAEHVATLMPCATLAMLLSAVRRSDAKIVVEERLVGVGAVLRAVDRLAACVGGQLALVGRRRRAGLGLPVLVEDLHELREEVFAGMAHEGVREGLHRLDEPVVLELEEHVRVALGEPVAVRAAPQA